MNLSEQLAPYGYTADEANVISTPKGTDTGVCIERRGGRLAAVSTLTGKLLWTGRDVSNFLESYWYARKLAP